MNVSRCWNRAASQKRLSYQLFNIVLLLLILPSISFCQTGTLSGIVLNSFSKEPIAGSNIFLQSEKSTGVKSDGNGIYVLDLPVGDQTLICSYIGYTSDTFSVVIEEGKATTYNVLLQEKAMELSTIVVSAGKYEQNLEDLTVSMEVLKPKLIENKNTTNITQALEQVPGLNILDEEPQIRGGSGFAFGVGSRVATLIDGIPILRGDIGKPDWSFIPIENLSQVEVIKGASSVLYGSSALSGVINFLTQYPVQPSELKIRLYSGYYNMPQNVSAKWWNGIANFSGLNISQAWKTSQFDFIIGGQLLYDHNYIGPPIPDPNLSFEQDSLSNKQVADRSGRINFNFRFRPKNIKGLSLGINGNVMRQHSNFSLIWGDDSSKIYRAFPNTITLTNDFEWYLDPFINYFTKSGLRHQLRSRIYIEQSEDPGVQRTASDVYYFEYQVYKALSKLQGLNVTGGALINQSVTHDDLFATSIGRDNMLHNYAAYLQLDKKFLDVLNVSLGVRGEYYQLNKTEKTLKPVVRAGANLKLARATFLRLSYGQGFRYPTIAEKYIRTTVGGLIVYPNPQLQPETSWNSELGMKQGLKLGKWLGYADGAVFWQEFHNTIEYNYALWSPDSAGFKFVNIGDTRVRGFDFSLTGDGKVSKNISLTILGGYTYTLPQSVDPHFVYATENPGEGFIPKQLNYIATSSDTTDAILKYRFQHIAKIDAEATYKKLFSAGISIRYYSFMRNIDKTFYDIDRSGTLPTGIINYREVHNNGTWVTDARFSFAFSKHYKAAFIVNNIFNLEYSLRPVKIEAPRTLALQLSADI